jgi:hypothetical protein
MKTLDEILQAVTYTDLFKEGTKRELRSLLKQAHPDLHPHDTVKAKKAFIRINELWNMKDTPDVHHTQHQTNPASNDIATKKNHYHHLKPVRKSNGVQTYKGIDSNGNIAFLLVSTHPKIGELLIEGVKNLKTVKSNLTNNYKEFFPDTTDAFRINQNGAKLFGVAQTLPEVNYSLREVKEDYPEGIDGRDIAWMYRRMLVAVGNVHDYGIGFGAPTLDAFLITPATHELQLTNWQFSRELGAEISIVTDELKHVYQADKTITREKDLKILSETALNLTNSKTPRPIAVFLKGMTRFPTAHAQEALHEFDEILRKVYGPRTFHEFKMRRNN